MLIVKEALIKAEELEIVVVCSRDMEKGFASISKIAEQLHSEMRGCLPLTHTVSGYDSVSATYKL